MGNVIKKVTGALKKNSPEILIGTGIAGFIATSVMAYKSAPKVNLILCDAEAENPDIRFIDKAMIVAKNMWPTFTVGALSTASLVCSGVISHQRFGALTAALTLSERALADFQESTLKKVGEEKMKEIKEDIVEKKLNESEVKDVQTVVVPENGGVLCYDTGSDRYFYSTKNRILMACNRFNEILRHEDTCSLNEFYNEMGLDDTRIGEFLGWDISDGPFEVEIGSKVAGDGRPCLTVVYPCKALDKFLWM